MIPHRLLQVFEWLNIFRGIISLVNCEFFHASSNCFHVQIIWSTANNCKVSLQCELPYAASSGLNTQMTWYILNNCRVSLLCDFLHDSLDRLLVQMICYTANNCKVSLQCEFLHVSLNRMHVQRIYYIANNCRVRVLCFAFVSRQKPFHCWKYNQEISFSFLGNDKSCTVRSVSFGEFLCAIREQLTASLLKIHFKNIFSLKKFTFNKWPILPLKNHC